MRDQKTENEMKQGGYKFKYVEKLPFNEIDLKASEENPARLRRKIDDFVVTQYGCAMLEGPEACAAFPAIVVFVVDRAKHLVGTGMHRIKAKQEAFANKQDWFDAYLVNEPDQYRQELLLRLLNSLEGVRDTKRDQLYHLVSLHEKYPGHSLAELAKQFHIPPNTVVAFWNEQQGIKRATRLGFDFENKQTQSTIIALNQVNSDLVYMKAAELVSHFEVKGRTVEEMVREIKSVKAKGQDAEFAVVKKYHDQAEEAHRRARSRTGKTSPTQATKLVGTCRSLNRLAGKGVEHLHLSALTHPRDALNVIEDALEQLGKVKAELERIMRMTVVGGTSGYPIAAAPPSGD
jgi:hypothetical protein